MMFNMTGVVLSGNAPIARGKFPYIAETIEDGEVNDGSWRRANGIDDLIACFENQLPDYSNYFPTRDPDPTSYDENVSEPSGWNRGYIEDIWKYIMYDE